MTNSISPEGFLLLVKEQWDDIKELKDRAWKVTHYSVLAQAAIFALHTAWRNASYWLFVILSALVVLWALALVSHFQDRIRARRRAVKELEGQDHEQPIKKSFKEVHESIRDKPNRERTEDKCEWPRWKELIPDWGDLVCRWRDDLGIGVAYVLAILIPAMIVTAAVWSAPVPAGIGETPYPEERVQIRE